MSAKQRLKELKLARLKVENGVIVPYDEEPKYTDNSKEGAKKRRRESILKKLKPIKEYFSDEKSALDYNIDMLRGELEEFEEQLNDVEYALEHVDSVYESISKDGKVSREDLKHCEELYESFPL